MDEKKKKIGFFGLDLYSLQSSREEVINYLENNAPGLLNLYKYNLNFFLFLISIDLAKLARKNYRCFEKYSDEHEYGVCAGTNLSSSCEKEAIKVLTKMLERHAKLTAKDNRNDTDADESFYAMENAKIVREAEKYYRHMFESGQITWNIRDTHMCDCLQDLLKHYGPGTKAIIWVTYLFILIT